MVALQHFARFLLAEPFRPFRIVTRQGMVYDVKDGSMAFIGRSFASLSMGMSEDPVLSQIRDFRIPFEQIESLQPLALR